MRKILFLISICLLSQSFSIASATVGDGLMPVVPVPNVQGVSSAVSAVPKNSVPSTSQNINAKAPVPVAKNNSTLQKQTTKTVNVKENSTSQTQTPKTSVTKSISNSQNVQNIKTTTRKVTPPVPMSVSEYREQAVSNIETQEAEKKLNMWAQKNGQQEEKKQVEPVRAKIVKVEFSESKIFSESELQDLAAPLLEKPVTIEEIQKVVTDITRCYVLGDYVTSKAYLPPQDLSDGVLKIGLMEGTVGKVKVEGNRWTRTSYIQKRVDNKEGEILKISDIEKDVIKFNNNNAVKLRVGLNAGEEQGETDITLQTEDPFPFHVAFMTDNQGRQAVGVGRFGAMLAADSLFGFRDRLSFGGYLGRGNRVGFADYNIPVGRYGTRLGASVSAGNISVVNGPMRAFGVGGTSQVYSVYVTHPLFDRIDTNISSYTAANIKHSTSDIADFKFYDKSTFSVTQGFTARKDTERGIWYTGHYGSAGFKALSGDTDFFKYEGNITRLHDFGKGIIGQFRVFGQYSPNDDLPWMEQFQIGGLSTVRGYSEGLLLGKSGYFTSAEIMTPLPILPKRIGSDKLGYIYPREMIKGAVFWDNGMIFPYKADGSSVDSGEFLMSWGLGLRINIRQDLAARMYWGFGLNNKYEVDQKMGRFHFEITCAPDIGRVVADRKPSKKHKEKESL